MNRRKGKHNMRKYLAAIALLAATPAHAITYNVDAIFPQFGNPAFPTSYLPTRYLTGTIDITGGQIVSFDLAVSGVESHFTSPLFNQSLGSGFWLLSAYNANRDDRSPQGSDYLSIEFKATPGPYLIGFEQGRITNGSANNYKYDPITTVGTTQYYGIGLNGTICPVDGCAPFPIFVPVPGPIVGAGLPSILGGLLAMWWVRRRKPANDNLTLDEEIAVLDRKLAPLPWPLP